MNQSPQNMEKDDFTIFADFIEQHTESMGVKIGWDMELWRLVQSMIATAERRGEQAMLERAIKTVDTVITTHPFGLKDEIHYSEGENHLERMTYINRDQAIAALKALTPTT